MFHTSTQRAHWLFDSEAALAERRRKNHATHVAQMQVGALAHPPWGPPGLLTTRLLVLSQEPLHLCLVF